MTQIDRSFFTLAEAAPKLGLKLNSARNMLAAGTFPVPAFKLASRWVVDKVVVDEFFRLKREEGLKQLRESTNG
jgi:hypothetical protein